jgi:hypothetical protein
MGLIDTARRAGLLGSIFGGQFDPRLSQAQNEAVQRQAIIQAGLATIAGSGPNAQGVVPGTLQSMAQGALHGQAYGQQARTGLYDQQKTLQAQQILQGMMSDPSLTRALTPGQLAAVRASSGDAEAAIEMMQEFLQPQILGEGDVAFAGREGVSQGRPNLTDAAKDFTFWAGLPPDMRQDFLRMQNLDPRVEALYMSALRSLGVDLETASADQLQEAWRMAMAAREAGATSINTDFNPNAANAAVDDAIGREQAGVIDQRADAQQLMASIGSAQQALAALEESGSSFVTGPWSEATLKARQFLWEVFEVGNPEVIGLQEFFRSLGNQQALLRKEGLTGQMSDRDIIFLQQQVIQLAASPQGNRQILDYLGRIAQRKIHKADMLVAWRSGRDVYDPVTGDLVWGRTPDGRRRDADQFEFVWKEYISRNHLFDAPEEDWDSETYARLAADAALQGN